MTVRRTVVLAGAGALVLLAAPTAAADPPPVEDIDNYPVAQGNYTATDFYWVFFRTPDGHQPNSRQQLGSPPIVATSTPVVHP